MSSNPGPACVTAWQLVLQVQQRPRLSRSSHAVSSCKCAVIAAGCTLPVEMFFPEEEYPTKAVEQELEQLGVLCSVLPDLVPSYAIQNSSNTLNDSEGKRLAGFSMKSAALLLSSFEEVRFTLFHVSLAFMPLTDSHYYHFSLSDWPECAHIVLVMISTDAVLLFA